ncbi:MAG: DUF2442 domain-containing protein [Candidatus Hydrogenedentes bacterium]|nr:DUF2442 domain-containing protein [Candidatus Hydrogenedentota bacterium]
MIPWVIDASYLGDFRVHLTFNDGASGEVDLAGELDGEIFEPLNNPAYFRNFHLAGHTLAWENGADFAPEFLRALLEATVEATR